MPAPDPPASAAGSPLDPGRVIDGLEPGRLGAHLHYFTEIASTNISARQMAEQGAPQGEIVIAESQTQGRGRLGRRWVSPPYANLYFSVILRPRLQPAQAPQVTLMAAVALAETLQLFLPIRPVIKWPNDVLVEGKKLAGILTELSCSADRVEFIILGIGVNLNYPSELMPEELRARATSVLAASGERADREVFLRRLIQHLDRCYGEFEDGGFGALAHRWERFFALRGRQVRVELLDQVVTGTIRGIDHDGALILMGPDGTAQRVIAGDVIPAGE